MTTNLFECVINISEGRNHDLLVSLDAHAGASLRDRHSDHFHNRSVFTLINTAESLIQDVSSLLHRAYKNLDLIGHEGVHPRFGVVDVVPFVALESEQHEQATELRNIVAKEVAYSEDISIFFYGPLQNGGFRTLPEVRKRAFKGLVPDLGPSTPSPHKGASAFGSRPILVAWNLWVGGISLDKGKEIAKGIRDPFVRTLAFQAGDQVQISCNLLSPVSVTPEKIYWAVSDLLPDEAQIDRAELVGLAPQEMLEAIPVEKWKMLGLSPSTTIESRL